MVKQLYMTPKVKSKMMFQEDISDESPTRVSSYYTPIRLFQLPDKTPTKLENDQKYISFNDFMNKKEAKNSKSI